MSFYNEYLKYKDFDFYRFFKKVTDKQIIKSINKSTLDIEDFLILLSPQASFYLEEMAQKAHRLTVQHFGKTILLYTPLYLSNYCTNQCVYCSFNCKNSIQRKQLTLEEVEDEARTISSTGLKHIIILTGDARGIATVEYISKCTKILRKYFPSIAIEVYTMSKEEYEILIDAGVDLLTVYQETYNEKLYDRLHKKGPKKDYKYRLDAPERACKANIRAVNIGALLGLDKEWIRDAFLTGFHALYLQNLYLDVEISVSLPRIRPHVGSYKPGSIVRDRDMVQIMTALRLFMPRVGITISTRENADFRNNIIQLGVTKMSAGSITAVGGHYHKDENTSQFEISDERDVGEMKEAIYKLGYQPVFKDWHFI
ncbi:MAG: 2-iminoacetate synthase ThiH [Epulopiscium sp.]|nr:2-iminoacetate synthase ThiH [Candidatus Epulonipiscium sp.]